MGLIMPAYAFPRDMPTMTDGVQPFNAVSFDPMYTQVASPTRGATPQVVNLAADLWTMQFATHLMEYIPAQEYLAWLQSLRGGARTFKAWHPLLRYPRNYPGGWTGLVRSGGATPFDGTANLSAIAGSRDSITINTLPNSFVFTIGDMVSIAIGSTSRSLHRVMESATGNGSGVAVITVEPVLPLAVVTSSEVLLEKPYCLAVVDAKSIKGPFQKGQIASVQFNATQTY